MKRVVDLVRAIAVTPDCRVFAAAGQPVVEEGHILPADLKEFYEICGGVSLFESAPFSATIVGPERCVLANPVIVGARGEGDISSSWYIIADDSNSDYLTLDLAPERLGRCYDSFFDRHGVVGSCSIIARSFTELLERLIENRGRHWYWLREDFVRIGDAYG